MIKIELTVDQFNKINQFGKRYNDIKNKTRQNLRYTRLTVKGDNLRADTMGGGGKYPPVAQTLQEQAKISPQIQGKHKRSWKN